MNKKGQQGLVGFIFLIIVFLILFGLWIGKFINDITHQMVVEQDMGGIEAFLFENLGLFIVLALILGILYYFAFGASR
jgi:hypothetical protein